MVSLSRSMFLFLSLLPNRLLIGELENDEFLVGEVRTLLGEETDSFYSPEKSNPLGSALERTMLEHICHPVFSLLSFDVNLFIRKKTKEITATCADQIDCHLEQQQQQ